MPKYIENYALYEQVGSGVYGKVYRAINNKDQKEYAVKVIPITKFRENKKLEECTVNQINILTNIETNQHIIHYYDMLKTTNNFYFIYQYCNGGTLDQVITKEGKLQEAKALKIFGELLQAFKVLNKYNIMHRDLKPDNIFFHDGVIKLGDFGFCKNLESADEMTRTMLGSPIYMAPEVIKGEVYSNKSDIWSLGVVLYEMIFGHCPFMSNSIAKLIEVLSTQKLTFPCEISPFVANLLDRMLTKDSVQRIGWLQLFMLKIGSDGGMSNGDKHILSLEDAQSSEETSRAPASKNQLPREPVSQPQSSGNIYPPQEQHVFKKKSNSNRTADLTSTADSRHNYNIPVQHKKVVEGVKLAMDLVSSKINNSMGFGNLVLTQTIKLLTEQQGKCKDTQIQNILAAELRDLRREQETISKKMFSYELKGIDDWKKYLRGKFFEEENTIVFWHRMVFFMDGKPPNHNLNFKAMSEAIKSILY